MKWQEGEERQFSQVNPFPDEITLSTLPVTSLPNPP